MPISHINLKNRKRYFLSALVLTVVFVVAALAPRAANAGDLDPAKAIEALRVSQGQLSSVTVKEFSKSGVRVFKESDGRVPVRTQSPNRAHGEHGLGFKNKNEYVPNGAPAVFGNRRGPLQPLQLPNGEGYNRLATIQFKQWFYQVRFRSTELPVSKIELPKTGITKITEQWDYQSQDQQNPIRSTRLTYSIITRNGNDPEIVFHEIFVDDEFQQRLEQLATTIIDNSTKTDNQSKTAVRQAKYELKCLARSPMENFNSLNSRSVNDLDFEVLPGDVRGLIRVMVRDQEQLGEINLTRARADLMLKRIERDN